MPCFSTSAMKSAGVQRARADFAKCSLAQMKFSGWAFRFVKLQRPPPEIRIFLPQRSARSRTATRRPRLPASIAHIRPAAPPPITMASKEFAETGSVISAACRIKVKLRGDENETVAANYQCTGAFKALRRRAIVPEYFVHDIAGRPHRVNRSKWLGKIYAAGDSGGAREARHGRRGCAQGRRAWIRPADFGFCGGGDVPERD